MAKRFEYRPYNVRKSDRRVRYILIALAACAVLLVVLIRWRYSRSVVESTVQESVVVLKELNGISAEPVEIPLPKAEAADAAPLSKAVETSRPVESPVVPAAPATVQPENLPVQGVVSDAVGDADRTALAAGLLLRQALADKNAGRIIDARDRLNRALDLKLSDTVCAEVKNQLTGLSQKWLFSKDILTGDALSSLYEVQPGETLAVIARRCRVPHEMLALLNDIRRPELLQAGGRIKIINGPFSVVVKRSTFTMELYLQGVFVKSYKVGLGRDKFLTPTGKWLVAMGGKLIKPTWTDPDTGRTYIADDPDYPLGSRWIALDGIDGAAKGRTGFAIHGTKDPQSIGTQSSRGCIRLFNGDAIEVYDLMEPGFSEVLVID